ncbi:MAG: DNA repair protein RecN [Desulforudis sp.]|nr:MAG: DNA repair protein RecN [Desulforudis sp.]
MLQRLLVKNFTLIDDLAIEFSTGLNVLSGETGAGKSLIIDALQVVLGRRASAELVRTGCEKAVLEAVFDLDTDRTVGDWLIRDGYDLEDGFLVLTREIWRSGRNVCRVNGRTISVSAARGIGERLVDFHGQGEQQSLLRENRHRNLLDRFGGEGLMAQRDRVEAVYREWTTARDRLRKLETGAKERARRLDILQYQIEEIDCAGLTSGEDKSLEEERELLANAGQISRLAGEAYEALYGGEGPLPAGIDRLGAATTVVDQLARIYRDAGEISEQLNNVRAEVDDIARRIVGLRDRAEFNPVLLETVEERLAILRRLKQKYGDTIEAILAFREAADAERITLESGDAETGTLAERVEQLARRWQEEAALLSRMRADAAERFCAAVVRELADLEIGNVKFEAEMAPLEAMSPVGAESVEFLFSANPGEAVRSLSRIASGGELSRVMLALKTLLAEVDEVPTLVFDEVDVGVGGRALQAVGEKLADIALHRQVLCVTHAAHVACYARQHLLIRKQTGPGLTRTVIDILDGEALLEELARMLGGREVTENTRMLARELRSRGVENQAG